MCKIGDKINIEVYAEICCEECNDIIHNHIDCPVCKNEYASTGNYGYIEKTDDVYCEECGSEFKLLSDSWYYGCFVEIIKIKD